MGFGFFKKKTKEKSEISETEKYVIDALKEGTDSERALIMYILLKSKTNDISLAQKDGATYINFRSEKIQTFLRDWFNILTLRQHNRISENIYQMFIASQLEDEKPREEQKEQPQENKKETDNEFDDFFDIFNNDNIE